MPDLEFTLPHWLYWLGLIVFPIIAMSMARRTRAGRTGYSAILGYGILLVGGMIGLHRIYLRSLLGLVYLPVFLFILYANSNETTARGVFSQLQNEVRAAQRIIDREGPRVEQARASVEGLRAQVVEAEAGSLTERRLQRQLRRAEQTITQGAERFADAETRLAAAQPQLVEAATTRENWNLAARYAFFVILAFLLFDLFRIPALVRQANALITPEDIAHEEEVARTAAATAKDTVRDADRASNRIDRLSLLAGEFVSYWAVIAVFVYYYEVIARYVFGSPTNWAHESMYLMFGMQYLIAGAYAMLTESHVRVDIFYAPMPRKKKAWTDLATSIFFFIFAGTLLWTSYIFAMDALAVPTGNGLVSDWARGTISFGEMLGSFNLAQWTNPNIRWGEISFNEWEVPLWPMKWVMVLGAILLLFQGISKILKDIETLRRGVPAEGAT